MTKNIYGVYEITNGRVIGVSDAITNYKKARKFANEVRRESNVDSVVLGKIKILNSYSRS